MSAAAHVARALGGTPASAGWFKCRCPLPSHGARSGDRRPSLSIRDGDTRLLVRCYAGCDARDVLAELRRRGLLGDSLTVAQRTRRPNANALNCLAQPTPVEGNGGVTDHERRQHLSDADRASRALALWHESGPLTGIARQYFTSREIHDLPLPDLHGVLRFHPSCPFGRGERHPCIVALLRNVLRRAASST